MPQRYPHGPPIPGFSVIAIAAPRLGRSWQRAGARCSGAGGPPTVDFLPVRLDNVTELHDAPDSGGWHLGICVENGLQVVANGGIGARVVAQPLTRRLEDAGQLVVHPGSPEARLRKDERVAARRGPSVPVGDRLLGDSFLRPGGGHLGAVPHPAVVQTPRYRCNPGLDALGACIQARRTARARKIEAGALGTPAVPSRSSSRRPSGERSRHRLRSRVGGPMTSTL